MTFRYPNLSIIVPPPGSRTGSGARRKEQAVAQLLCARMLRRLGRDCEETARADARLNRPV
jgi:hypothetical protein